MTTAYRSVFSGQEIDQAIASMKVSTAGFTISNDFTGGTTKAGSAELSKILKERIDELEDPVTLLGILNQYPDFNIFTDAHKAKVEFNNTNFRGVFTTAADRDTKIAAETSLYIGREICIVLDNGAGVAEIQRWDVPNTIWKRIKLFGVGEFDSAALTTASTIPVFSFKTSSYNTMKCLVSVGTVDGAQRQSQEIMVSYIGNDVYLSIYGDVGNAQLFNVSTNVTDGVVTLSVTTLSANTKVSAKQLAVI